MLFRACGKQDRFGGSKGHCRNCQETKLLLSLLDGKERDVRRRLRPVQVLHFLLNDVYLVASELWTFVCPFLHATYSEKSEDYQATSCLLDAWEVVLSQLYMKQGKLSRRPVLNTLLYMFESHLQCS